VASGGARRSALGETIHLLAPPPEVAAADVASHVDDLVVLEGRVTTSVAKGGTVVLTLADAPEVVHIVIVAPMVGERPSKLAPRFVGQRVRALGKVREFEGHYEIFVTDPERVELLDEAAVAAAVAPQPSAVPQAVGRPPARVVDAAAAEHAPRGETPREPAAPPAARSAPAPAAASATAPAAVAAVPPPAPAVEAPPVAAAVPVAAPSVAAAPALDRRVEAASPPVAPPNTAPAPRAREASTVVADDGECRAARADWQAAAVAARAPLDGLKECLASGQPPCAADLAAVRSTLAELAADEQRIAWLCGAAR
jgi:hypothetical protein